VWESEKVALVWITGQGSRGWGGKGGRNCEMSDSPMYLHMGTIKKVKKSQKQEGGGKEGDPGTLEEVACDPYKQINKIKKSRRVQERTKGKLFRPHSIVNGLRRKLVSRLAIGGRGKHTHASTGFSLPEGRGGEKGILKPRPRNKEGLSQKLWRD